VRILTVLKLVTGPTTLAMVWSTHKSFLSYEMGYHTNFGFPLVKHYKPTYGIAKK